jgi:hypothetical protein
MLLIVHRCKYSTQQHTNAMETESLQYSQTYVDLKKLIPGLNLRRFPGPVGILTYVVEGCSLSQTVLLFCISTFEPKDSPNLTIERQRK